MVFPCEPFNPPPPPHTHPNNSNIILNYSLQAAVQYIHNLTIHYSALFCLEDNKSDLQDKMNVVFTQICSKHYIAFYKSLEHAHSH